MKVCFVASDPRERANPILDSVLSAGSEQLAIACAFLTPGGVEVLRRHAGRLRLPSSFVVVSWDPPTSIDALNELHALMPGNLYVHLGAKTPVEQKVGPGLMHSKVFFSRGPNQCQLWTGSHNLTASATQGVNCEAAVLVEGDVGDPVFADALAHLNRCREEAIRFDPQNPPTRRLAGQALVIHAECHAALKSPPWFVHLRAPNTDYDRVMLPPVSVWLYLYDPGTLRAGRPRPEARVAYSGTLTALNFTEKHPKSRGISADWNEADYVIDYERGVFCLGTPASHANTQTQGVFRVQTEEDPKTIWLSKSPAPTLERIASKPRISAIAPAFRKFFTKQSLSREGLVHQAYCNLRSVVLLPRTEVGPVEKPDLPERLPLPPGTELVIDETVKPGDKFVFIYRGRYRL